jgi:hypothetical protein
MNLKRTTIVFVGGAALAAWFSAAMTPGRPAAPAFTIAPAPIDASGEKLASEIDRLRERLRPSSPPGAPVRNPFAFGSSRRGTTGAGAPSNSTRRGSIAAAQAPPRIQPQLTLAGIAEDSAPDGPVRTAIVSGSSQVFLVKIGDTISDGGWVYRIAAISPDSVELIDPADGSTRVLVLR